MDLEMVQGGDSGAQLFDFEADAPTPQPNPGEDEQLGCCDCAWYPHYTTQDAKVRKSLNLTVDKQRLKIES